MTNRLVFNLNNMWTLYHYVLSGVLIAFMAWPASAAEIGPVRDAKRMEVLVIGKVSDNPRKHYRRLAPMLDYVVERMADLGIRKGRVLMARDNQQMIRYLKQGRIDWITETLFSALLYRRETGAELLLRKWKKGVPVYHTVFVTRKDSGIEKLEDLKGKRIGFEDPGSTTAFFLPVKAIVDTGLLMKRLDSVRETPAPGVVNYVFGRQEINLSTWLAKGFVDAVALSNLDWERDNHMPSVFRDEFRIFHRTEPVPRALEVVRGGLDPAVKARLKALLLGAEADPDAGAVLESYQSTRRFDELTPELMRIVEDAEATLETVQYHTR